MMIAISGLWEKIVAWWYGPKLVELVELAEDEPERPLIIADARKTRERHEEDGGAHYYLGDLLDNLNSAFRDISIFRAAHPDTAALFEQSGISVANSRAGFSKDIEPSFFRNLPSLGAMWFGGEGDDEEIVLPSFTWFKKEKRPINVQCSNYTIYEVGFVYHFKKGRKSYPTAVNFYVSVSEDGSVTPLKQIVPSTHRLPRSKNRKNSTGQKPKIVRMTWQYPTLLQSFVDQWNEDRKPGTPKKTVEDVARRTLAMVSNIALHADYGMTVRCKKGGKTCVFAIDMLRTPYFFADRQKTVNENGRTRPIFHIVRSFQRNGKWVKSHFRGVRRFEWNGYSVTVGLPGKHQPLMSDFSVAATDEINLEPEDKKKAYTNRQVGQILGNLYETGEVDERVLNHD